MGLFRWGLHVSLVRRQFLKTVAGLDHKVEMLSYLRARQNGCQPRILAEQVSPRSSNARRERPVIWLQHEHRTDLST
jgi:hypothetical protein